MIGSRRSFHRSVNLSRPTTSSKSSNPAPCTQDPTRRRRAALPALPDLADFRISFARPAPKHRE